MDTSRNMILVNGKIRTSAISYCSYNNVTQKMDVKFKNIDKIYSYAYNHIVWMTNPNLINQDKYVLSHNGIRFPKTATILLFKHAFQTYYHIIYPSGFEQDYEGSEISIQTSCLDEKGAKNLMQYFTTVAMFNDLQDEEGVALLYKIYQKISFIDDQSAASRYLTPAKSKLNSYGPTQLIYPFGCNASQKKAVERALGNQISVIQGPPGTGKTQTILNIIANIICQKKTVLVVSNNNSATANVMEKLEKYDYDFIVAQLGCQDNKKAFCELQYTEYPEEIKNWSHPIADNIQIKKELGETLKILGDLFKKQEQLARSQQEYKALQLEQKHYLENFSGIPSSIQINNKMTSKQLVKLWNEMQIMEDQHKQNRLHGSLKAWWENLMLNFKIRILFKPVSSSFLRLGLEEQISILHCYYYQKRIEELESEIENLQFYLKKFNLKQQVDKLTRLSNEVLQNELFKKYGQKKKRTIFELKEIAQDAVNFLKEYPVVLSTTFSSRSNFDEGHLFDYVIMDESSQVSSETGLLALSCAKNAVIVGDSMQLPNVVTEEDKNKLDLLAQNLSIPEGYSCAKYSFLESVCKIIPNVPQTLLQEHYRCHPKIINFCNQKFYHGQLAIMTEDHDEQNVVQAIKTVKGNHSRNHWNQREIDVITEEVLPALEELGYEHKDIGIIAPYNNQVNILQRSLAKDIDIATVHKFQGREKDVIIMTTVDDKITSFSDDPHLLNVAISRAKKLFYLVVSGNEQPSECNISNLLDYIEYNNFTIKESKIHSIFDFLYKQYTAARIEFLKEHKQVSEYASENLTYALIEKILHSNSRYSHLDVICHLSLNNLLKDYSVLESDEVRYVANEWTHLDFLIYNRVSKQAVLAIETDGYMYHHEGTRQAERDKRKDQVLEKYGLPLLRLSTTGSNEEKRIEEKLDNILGQTGI